MSNSPVLARAKGSNGAEGELSVTEDWTENRGNFVPLIDALMSEEKYNFLKHMNYL